MSNKAIDSEIYNILRTDTDLMASIKEVYQDQVPRGKSFPVVVLTSISDDNSKQFLSSYGGSANIQLDIYSKNKDMSALRLALKNALRKIRGVSNDLIITALQITQDQSFGIEETGLWRWMFEINVNYREG